MYWCGMNTSMSQRIVGVSRARDYVGKRVCLKYVLLSKEKAQADACAIGCIYLGFNDIFCEPSLK